MKPTLKKAMKNLEEEVRKNKYPRCFESMKQYKEWQSHEDIAHTTQFRKNICEDCTAVFKTQMVLQKKCVNMHIVVKG